MNTRFLKPARFALLLLLTPLAACDVRAQDGADAAPTNPPEAAELSRSVRVVQAESGVLRVSRSASATVEPVQESQVSAGATGQVERILAQSGTQVEAGEAVIQLDDAALQLQRDNAQLALETARINLLSAARSSSATTVQSEAALQGAQASLDISRQQVAEGEALLAAGGISETELAQLRVGLEQTEAAFLQAQAAAAASRRAPEENLELLRLGVAQAETQVAQAQQGLSDAQLSAPYAGEVAEVLVAEGEFIGAGSPAFRLVSAGRQRARFSVAPEDAERLLAQELIWLPYNGLDYAARPTRSSQTQGGRLVEVVADIYPSETPIPSGTVTQFEYQLELARGVLLPSAALRQSNGQASVLTVQAGRATEVPVTLLGEGGAQVVVAGLKAGAQVIYPLPADLTPGTPVEVLDEPPQEETSRGGGA